MFHAHAGTWDRHPGCLLNYRYDPGLQVVYTKFLRFWRQECRLWLVSGEPTIDALRTVSLFEALTDAELELVSAAGTHRPTAAGDVLVRQGDRADQVYVVLAGQAVVQLDGNEVGPPLGPGECIGELAVLDDAPRAATVIAVGPMTLHAFSAETFTAVLNELPELRNSVTRALTRRLRTVSSGWAQLAADTDVLLEAYFAIQGSADEQDRHKAIQDAAALLSRLAEAAPGPEAHAELDALTPAERRVADLVARGLSNAAVAAELFLSEHTVASHLKHIYVKLGLPSRVALARLVLRSA